MQGLRKHQKHQPIPRSNNASTINQTAPHRTTLRQQPDKLLAFAGNPRKNGPKGIPFRYTDYFELVDWTGRILRDDKKGSIPKNTPEILIRLNIDSKHWIYLTRDFESPFKTLVGNVPKSFLKHKPKQPDQTKKLSLKPRFTGRHVGILDVPAVLIYLSICSRVNSGYDELVLVCNSHFIKKPPQLRWLGFVNSELLIIS